MQRSGLHGYYRTGIIVSGFGMSSGYECTGEVIVEDSFIRQPHGMLQAMPMLQRELGQRNPGRTVPHTVPTQYGHRVPRSTARVRLCPLQVLLNNGPTHYPRQLHVQHSRAYVP